MEKETKTIGKLTVEMGTKDYVLTGGSGGITPGVPIPENTVDTNAIIDGAVEMQDLNDRVKDQIIMEGDRVTQEDLDNFDI